jgi:4-hydroxythreonine-4-phosphate dehydrogenase
MTNSPILGLTVGDPSGIGPEIACTATRKIEGTRDCRCILYGDERVIRRSMPCVHETRGLNRITDATAYQPGMINYVEVGSITQDYEFRKVQGHCGKAAYDYVECAIRDAMAGRIDAVVTGPLNKEALNLGGKHFAGHTEIFAHLTGCKEYAMLLTGGALRVIHVSTHCSLREACDRAKKARILKVIDLANESAQALAGMDRPRIAVAGLNPHCGEGGLFGREEIDEIIPAIEEAQARGMDVTGPVPPDTVYMKAHNGMFDIVVAMYHDQGHIPLKIVDFMGGVNITVGLPVIRTSVDHGTAFGRAGQGRAGDSSLVAAIDAAILLAKPKA